jgi:hypothetical protein
VISVRKQEDQSFEILNGHTRLNVQLQIAGKAEVVNIATGEKLYVHEVDGKMVAISEDAQDNVDDLTNATINRARG